MDGLPELPEDFVWRDPEPITRRSRRDFWRTAQERVDRAAFAGIVDTSLSDDA